MNMVYLWLVKLLKPLSVTSIRKLVKCVSFISFNSLHWIQIQWLCIYCVNHIVWGLSQIFQTHKGWKLFQYAQASIVKLKPIMTLYSLPVLRSLWVNSKSHVGLNHVWPAAVLTHSWPVGVHLSEHHSKVGPAISGCLRSGGGGGGRGEFKWEPALLL